LSLQHQPIEARRRRPEEEEEKRRADEERARNTKNSPLKIMAELEVRTVNLKNMSEG